MKGRKKQKSPFQVKSPGVKVNFTASWARDSRQESPTSGAAPHLHREMLGHMISSRDHL